MKSLYKPLYIALIILGLILSGCPYEGEKQELSISKLEKAVLQIYHKVINKKTK
jgi:hypothetical protein